MENILFLDIDGVVTSMRTGWHNMDIYTVNFLRWVCKEANVKIVISSTWRHNHGYDFWLPIFTEFLHSDFKTPDLTTQSSGGIYLARKRGAEIKAWLDKHPEVKRYLILDDDSDMLPEQEQFFIQTDSLNGMLDTHMNDTREFWKIKSFPDNYSVLHEHPNMFASRKKKESSIIKLAGSPDSKMIKFRGF